MSIESQSIDRRGVMNPDAGDPLAPFRDRFLIPDGIIYMNGNSLGPLTRDARDRMDKVVGD